jgi:hypothetical protein
MEYLVRVVSEGDDLAIVFPPEILKDLKLSVGDSLHFTQNGRGFSLSRVNPDVHTDNMQNK